MKLKISISLLLVLSACSPDKREELPPPHRVLEGGIAEAIEKIQNDKDSILHDCDNRHIAKKLEIAQALDSRYKEIQAVGKIQTLELAARRNDHVIQAGPTFFTKVREYPEKRGPFAFEYGWDAVFAEFERIRNTGVNEDWYWLDSEARSLVIEDEKRLYYEVLMQVSSETGVEWLEKAVSEIQRCNDDPACLSPNFTPFALEKINTHLRYAAWMSVLASAEEAAKKRRVVGYLKKQLERDLRQYQFHRNDEVRRTAENTFSLPLLAGSIGGAAAAFSQLVLEGWSSDTRSLMIDWKSSYSGAYTINLGDTIGTRSYVDHTELRMEVSPGVYQGTLVHEMGHVLGLPDQYYTVWNPTTCDYKQYQDSTNVMASSRLGKVLPKHWAELDKHYPVAP